MLIIFLFISPVPSPPLNLSTQNVTPTSVIVFWDPPQDPNGILLGYEVSYTPNGGRLSAVDVQNNTTWKLSDMKPFTSYSISTRAKTVAGYGETSIPVIITTLESGMLLLGHIGYHCRHLGFLTSNSFYVTAVPSPPMNLKTPNVTSTSITVTWDPPQSPNGRLLGYEVSYTPKGGTQSAADAQNNTTWKLTDMKLFTTYSISVRAKTLAGYGERCSPVIVSTLESGMLLNRCIVTSSGIWSIFETFPLCHCSSISS